MQTECRNVYIYTGNFSPSEKCVKGKTTRYGCTPRNHCDSLLHSSGGEAYVIVDLSREAGRDPRLVQLDYTSSTSRYKTLYRIYIFTIISVTDIRSITIAYALCTHTHTLLVRINKQEKSRAIFNSPIKSSTILPRCESYTQTFRLLTLPNVLSPSLSFSNRLYIL